MGANDNPGLTMEETISLKLLWKRFAGSNMKLFFGSKDSTAAQKVLVLYNVVAFIENEVENIDCYLLQTRDGGSVYGLDMSMRLKKPQYADFIETFLFANKEGPDIAFRALSEKIKWCNFDTLSPEDLNY
jgi:hypothetical protein